MGATLPGVCTTDERYNSCLPGAENAPLAALPLLAQQHFETDEADCHSDSRATMCRKYGITQGAGDGSAIIRAKVLASLDCTDATNTGNIHYYQ